MINCICMHSFLGPLWYNVIHRERGLGLAMLIGLICPIHSHPTYLFIQSLHTDTHININHRQKQTHNTGFGLVIAMIKWSRWPWLYPSCLFQSIYVSSIRNSQQKTLCWLKFSFNRWKVHSQIGTKAVETQFFMHNGQFLFKWKCRTDVCAVYLRLLASHNGVGLRCHPGTTHQPPYLDIWDLG